MNVLRKLGWKVVSEGTKVLTPVIIYAFTEFFVDLTKENL